MAKSEWRRGSQPGEWVHARGRVGRAQGNPRWWVARPNGVNPLTFRSLAAAKTWIDGNGVKRRKKPAPPKTDPTVRSLLARIRARDMNALGVLADYVQEHGPAGVAKMLAATWASMQRSIAYWQENPPRPRSRWTQWQCIAHARKAAWLRVRRLYGRAWTAPRGYEAFK